MPVFKLSEYSNAFPAPELARDDGLLAIGGDLLPGRLLNAYANGIFPWYNPGEIIQWWCPKERFIIFPNKIHISRSMKIFINKTVFRIKVNHSFGEIMHNCRILRENATWISDEMEEAYLQLHKMGYALCVGVYDRDILVGGLYGVCIGKCFFGESMFSKASNASKLALIYLCVKLSDAGYFFIDCQFYTEHLASLGGEFVSWDVYKEMLRTGVNAK